ncbi:MAG: sialidase family protein [Bacteroidota bacterium]|nr:sialidase family protein [Bacteroidota bacterium]
MKMKLLIVSCFLLFGTITIKAQEMSNVPGTVINYYPASSGIYVGSPSLVVLPNGHYLATHDLSGPKGDTMPNAMVFISADRGKTWEEQGEVKGQYWSTIFYNKGSLYLIGTNKAMGAIVIRKSDDEGKTWTSPSDGKSGLIKDGKFHCAPTPILVTHGKIYRGFEQSGTDEPGKWCSAMKSFMIYSSVDADLLNADSWKFTNMVLKPKNIPGTGWLETNAVEDRDKRIVGLTRLNTEEDNVAGFYQLTPDGNQIDTTTIKTVEMPGACKKFTVRFDSKSKLFWALTNYPPDELKGVNKVERMRSVLTLISSPDLTKWTIRNYVLASKNVQKEGFQYVDWQVDGEDIVFVSRTAFDDEIGGADNCQNANFLTFHRIPNFRKIKENKLSEAWLKTESEE